MAEAREWWVIALRRPAKGFAGLSGCDTRLDTSDARIRALRHLGVKPLYRLHIRLKPTAKDT